MSRRWRWWSAAAYLFRFYQHGASELHVFHGEVVISSGGSGLFPTFARSPAYSELLRAGAPF